ncbi:unnamed protein product [Linum trigynum]|uniref:Uncharacterized protein n=1 Tax=Linum trigynum TaxID=586398 RepID=A0AAV2DIR7_9ROSI
MFHKNKSRNINDDGMSSINDDGMSSINDDGMSSTVGSDLWIKSADIKVFVLQVAAFLCEETALYPDYAVVYQNLKLVLIYFVVIYEVESAIPFILFCFFIYNQEVSVELSYLSYLYI